MRSGRSGGGAELCDDEHHLLAHGGGHLDASQLQRAGPAGDVGGQEGEQHVAEEFGLGVGVCVGWAAAEGVELFVVVIDDLVGGGQAFFALQVQPAALLVALGCLGGIGGGGGVRAVGQAMVDVQGEADQGDGGGENQRYYHQGWGVTSVMVNPACWSCSQKAG